MKIIFALLIALFLFSCDRGENEIYIVPKNYTGYIIVIYGQKKGTEPAFEAKKRVYKIPSNGVLKTQFTGNFEWTNFPEFYYEQIAPENKIPFKSESKNIPTDSIVAYGGISGSANKDLAGKKVVHYTLFYIGNNAQIDKAYEASQKLDIIKFTE